MEVLVAVLAILVAIAILFELARRLGVPYPTLFVLGGLGLALMPGPARRSCSSRTWSCSCSCRRSSSRPPSRRRSGSCARTSLPSSASRSGSSSSRWCSWPSSRTGHPGHRLGGGLHARRDRRPDGCARGNIGVPAARGAAIRRDAHRGRGPLQRRDGPRRLSRRGRRHGDRRLRRLGRPGHVRHRRDRRHRDRRRRRPPRWRDPAPTRRPAGRGRHLARHPVRGLPPGRPLSAFRGSWRRSRPAS